MSKPLRWLAREITVPPFSNEAAGELGALLEMVSLGGTLAMPHCRPMPTIGKRCFELRVNDRDQTWRVIYHVATDAVVILEVFSKKSQRTPHQVVERCRKRLKRHGQDR
ncbi:MAG: type II toxin-antitoxin system RelE/ParE family toxin [Gemmatimonadota bacterium]|nr:MAG: type II toxin-antitoxin system RelE/ParE family toxin [Gemmatimonadota bacterium]